MALSTGEKALIAIATLGGLLFIVNAANAAKKANTITATANQSNQNQSAPVLVNGNWNYTETVDKTTGEATVTINFSNVSTGLPEAGTITTIYWPYPLSNWTLTQNTTGISNPINGNVLAVVDNASGELAGIGIQGGSNATINGTLVFQGTVPSSILSTITNTSSSGSGTYG